MNPEDLTREMEENEPLKRQLGDILRQSEAEVLAALGEPSRVQTGSKFVEWWDDIEKDKVAATTVWEYDEPLAHGVIKVGFLPSGIVGTVMIEPVTPGS